MMLSGERDVELVYIMETLRVLSVDV